jgi:hypothetical protein
MRRFARCAVTLVLLGGSTAAHAQYEEVWTRTFHMNGGTSDEPVEICVDDSGNVYVVGTALHPTRAEDIVFIKYTASGGLVGANAINAAADSSDVGVGIAVDDSGQTYVVARTYSGPPTGFDCIVIKYGSDSEVIWSRTFDAGQDDADYARDIAMTSSGNVVVLGQSWLDGIASIGLTEYTPAGTEEWRRFFHWPSTQADDPVRMDRDSQGNIYVAASSTVALNTNILTVKFNATGDTLWARQYDGTAGGYDAPVGIAAAPDGGVYVAGSSEGTGTYSDIVLLKYESDGDLAWVKRHNGPADTADFAADVAVDQDGNASVAGTWLDDSRYFDGVAFGYLPDGTLDWLNTGYAFGHAYDDFTAIAIDSSGDVFATGSSRNVARPTSDVYTCRFDHGTGSNSWESYYAVDSGGDYGVDICVDVEGNLYVTGRTYSGAVTGFDIVTIKYAPTSSGIRDVSTETIPQDFILHQNHPNPFNSETIIRFDLDEAGPAELRIINTLGQTVAVFAEADLPPGSYALNWNGRDRNGRALASGVYFYQLTTRRNIETKKLVLVK